MAPARRPVPARWPWDQVNLDLHEVSLLKAISPAAFAVIEKVCGVGRNPFTAGGEDGRRATDFASGKLWVGNSLRDVRAMKMPGPKTTETGPHAVPKGPPPDGEFTT